MGLKKNYVRSQGRPHGSVFTLDGVSPQ
ncbi:hypothetical protein CNEO4_1990009 [Clostridium neonatale]|nr:hypothetical protein CNEO4_1990009 [Clostridium neonatale]